MPPKKSKKNRQNDPVDHGADDNTTSDSEEVTRGLSDSSLINLLPTFQGNPGESVNFFWENFKQISELAKWSSQHQAIILKSRLTGRARDFFASNEKLIKEINVHKIIEILEDKFNPKTTLAHKQREFQSIQFTPSMLIDELAIIIEKKANEYLNINERASKEVQDLGNTIKLTKLLELLPNRITVEIRKESIQIFSEAVKRAQELKSIFDEETLETNAIIPRQERNDSVVTQKLEQSIKALQNDILQIKDKVHNSTSPVHDINSYNFKNNFCEVCRKPGHETKNCWHIIGARDRQTQNKSNLMNTNSAGFNNYFCEFCTKPGHDIKDCWFMIDARERQQNRNKPANNEGRGAFKKNSYNNVRKEQNSWKGYSNSNKSRYNRNEGNKYNKGRDNGSLNL